MVRLFPTLYRLSNKYTFLLSNLKGFNLTGADLLDVNLIDALIDETTIIGPLNKKNNQTILHHLKNDHYVLNHDYIHENRNDDLSYCETSR